MLLLPEDVLDNEDDFCCKMVSMERGKVSSKSGLFGIHCIGQ